MAHQYIPSDTEGLTDQAAGSYAEKVSDLRLAYWLKKKGLSKRQFCIRLGVVYKNANRMFKPTYDPRVSQLNKIAKVLDIKIQELFEP